MIYVTIQEIIDSHSLIIRRYGGLDGIRDMGLLASALDMPKATMFGKDLHPSIRKQVEELASRTAGARDLNRVSARFLSLTPILDRLRREKFKDQDASAANRQLFNLFVYIFDKAAAYLFYIIRSHPFLDGNKRTAVVAALTFLRQNRVYIDFSKNQSHLFEELVVGVADNRVVKEQISVFLKSCQKA